MAFRVLKPSPDAFRRVSNRTSPHAATPVPGCGNNRERFSTSRPASRLTPFPAAEPPPGETFSASLRKRNPEATFGIMIHRSDRERSRIPGNAIFRMISAGGMSILGRFSSAQPKPILFPTSKVCLP
jgi:hypothetical protein